MQGIGGFRKLKQSKLARMGFVPVGDPCRLVCQPRQIDIITFRASRTPPELACGGPQVREPPPACNPPPLADAEFQG